MRNRLVISLALGVLVAVLAAGVSAGKGVSVNLPGGSSVDTDQVLPACSNLRDDDGDGLVDLGDSGCSSPVDGDESNPAPPTTTTPTTPPTTTTPPPTTTTPTDPDDRRRHDLDHRGHHLFLRQGRPARPPRHQGPLQRQGRQGRREILLGPGRRGRRQVRRRVDSDPGDPPPRRNADQGEPDGHDRRYRRRRRSASRTSSSSQFSIPPFLLPIYQACGTQYGIPWEVLASINRIETAFGTNLNVSTAGALGWMQFMPSTWEMYGVDANDDGRKDPYNPVDAICAAARYLKAAGGEQDLYQAIFAYNHADWYVDEVLLYAKQYGNLPERPHRLAHRPDRGRPLPGRRQVPLRRRHLRAGRGPRATPTKGASGNAADVISDSPTRRGINIYSKDGAPVVAVNDGVITKIGENKQLGKFIVLRDAYGNRVHLRRPRQHRQGYPGAEAATTDDEGLRPDHPGRGRLEAEGAASKTTRATTPPDEAETDRRRQGSPGKQGNATAPADDSSVRRRRPAPAATPPARPTPRTAASACSRCRAARQRRQARASAARSTTCSARACRATRPSSPTSPASSSFNSQDDGFTRRCARAPRSSAGTVLGRGRPDRARRRPAPQLRDHARPGRGAPTIDPKPILDGWKLLEATAIYRAAGKNPFDDQATAVGQVLLMSKDAARSARCSPTRGSRSTPAAATTSPPARSTGASWRRWSTWSRAATG